MFQAVLLVISGVLFYGVLYWTVRFAVWAGYLALSFDVGAQLILFGMSIIFVSIAVRGLFSRVKSGFPEVEILSWAKRTARVLRMFQKTSGHVSADK